MKPETFAIVIFCTSDPAVANAKTRSKWARVASVRSKSQTDHSESYQFYQSEWRFERMRSLVLQEADEFTAG